MQGFSDRFADPPDFILKITEEIWEGRGLRLIEDCYAPDVVLRFPSGLVRGSRAVIDGTLATLAEFPDRRLLGEDVIWSDDGDGGFLSSHRILTTGTHLGHGAFGPPTGKRFEIRAIADCAARTGAIYDEWLVRDVGGIARQLGLDPADYARHLIEREGGPDRASLPFTPADDVDGGYASRGNDSEWGARLADILTRIMDKDLTVIRERYDRAVRSEHPGSQGGWSWDFAERQWMALRAAFPSAEFAIHHVIGRADDAMPPRAAVRWSLDGTHDGFGAFGQPTGAPVHVMGITHADFGGLGKSEPKLRHEFTLWDEISIWKQIHLHTGLA